MPFNSITFIFCFLPISLAFYYLLKKSVRDYFLIFVSLLFYAWGNILFTFVLFCFIVVNYFLGKLIIRNKKRNEKYSKLFLVLGWIINFGVLFVFKYVETVSNEFLALLNKPSIDISLAVPLGLSYFTFKCISLLTDLYHKKDTSVLSFKNVCLYLSFFPQIASGPIEQYNNFEQQIGKVGKFNLDDFVYGVERFIIGLAKKVIIADIIGLFVDEVFAMSPNSLSIVMAWSGGIGYLLQEYFDFSGYSDIAIGVAKMFGYKTTENFNYPYISRSISEFWRRWHISLGEWLKKYIYMPLAVKFLSKKNPFSKTGKKFNMMQSDIIALFITWMVCGIWHGAGFKFVIWGLFFFVFLAIEHILKFKSKKIKMKHIPVGFLHIYTILVVMIGEILFRSESIAYFVQYLKSLFINSCFISSNFSYWFKNFIIIFILGIICSLPCVGSFFTKIKDINGFSKVFYYMVLLIICGVIVSFVVTNSYISFIYFQF